MRLARSKFLGALLAASLAPLAISSPAHACGVLLRITYGEDYPDWFLVEFINGEGFDLAGLEIDLSGSAGSAHIDTPYSQPSEPSGSGSEVVLRETLGFAMGSRRMAFKFLNFSVNKSYSLSVDLDGYADQLANSELFGTQATAHLKGPTGQPLTVRGKFDNDGVAELGNRACA